MAADLETLWVLIQKYVATLQGQPHDKQGKRVVTDLFSLFMSEPNTLPSNWQFYKEQALRDMTKTDRARIISDYIASMTDRYAIVEHERLFDLGPILR